MLPAEPIPPSDSWIGLLLSGGLTALASGLIAGLVAYLTVHWTQERGKESARLVASQAAALVMQRETKAAADVMVSALQIGELVRASNAHSSWRQELPFQQPLIVDPVVAQELSRYEQSVLDVHHAALRVGEAPGAMQIDDYGHINASGSALAWSQATAEAFDRQRQHLGQMLAAHRADRPLPTSPPAWRVPPFGVLPAPER